MRIADKLTTIAENEQKVYDAGYEKGKSEDAGQHSDGINPEWTDWRYFSFKNNRNDLVAKLKYSDTSQGKDFSSMLNSSNELEIGPSIDTSNGLYFNDMYYYCTKVKTIPPMNTSKGLNYKFMCSGCYELENITFEGVFNVTENLTVFSNSPKLTIESLMSFINALSDNSSLSTTYTVTIGSANLNKLTQAQIDIATAKNIRLA